MSAILLKRTSRCCSCDGRFGETLVSHQQGPTLWVEGRCAGSFMCSNRNIVRCGSSSSAGRTNCSCTPIARAKRAFELLEPIYEGSATMKPPLSAATSRLISRVNVTAVLRARATGSSFADARSTDSDAVVWHPASDQLPAVAGARTALFFVHSHRQGRSVFEAHASALSTSSDHWLVRDAHVLLFCNNPRLSASMLLSALARYPTHQGRMLIHTSASETRRAQTRGRAKSHAHAPSAAIACS